MEDFVMTLRIAAAALATLTALGSGAATSDFRATEGDRNTYVLVHGAWGSAWAYRPLDTALTALGHEVYRPSLTGSGERVHLVGPQVDLSMHIEDIVNTIRFEDLEDVVLVAHSYGGMVATGVADRIPERLRCIVYLDAFLPEDGESLLASTRGRDQEAFVKYLIASAEDGLIPAPGPPGDTELATGWDRRTPQPVRTLTETLTLENPAARAIPAKYILTVEAGKDEADDDFAAYADRARARDWPVVVMAAGHVPAGEEWDELARLLCDLPE